MYFYFDKGRIISEATLDPACETDSMVRVFLVDLTRLFVSGPSEERGANKLKPTRRKVRKYLNGSDLTGSIIGYQITPFRHNLITNVTCFAL